MAHRAAGGGGGGAAAAVDAVPADDEDVFDEEDEEMLRNIGEHDLMAPVQRALLAQLQRNKERVELELREKRESLTRIVKEREAVGVELYTVQQQLAKLQLQLETTHNNCNLVAGIRQKFEGELKEFQAALGQRKQEVTTQESNLGKVKEELDTLNRNLKDVQSFLEEMQGEISVTRRATYKVEETVSDLERDKKKQDLYIDSLNEQLKMLLEQVALLQAQLASQREETSAAQTTLAEASREMETIEFEKKQLLAQWKSSLVAMQRRDEALQATNDAVREQEQANQAVLSEIEGFKVSINKEQTRNGRLQERFDRADNESKFIVGQLEVLQRNRAALTERYSMLKSSLDQTDAENARLSLEEQNLIEQIAVLEQTRQTVDRERQAIEDQVAANKSTQTTVTKAARNLSKAAEKVMQVIHAKEMERATTENESARIRIDTLNTDAHVSQLQAQLDGMVSALRDKDALIEKYEVEIRQRNDEIEKKMYLVDRLNRRFEALTANVEDENMGPLEATIKNLGKQIAAKVEESERLQRMWLKLQTSLVDKAAVLQTQQAALREQETEELLLNQKRLRMDGVVAQQEEDIRKLRNAVEAMHTDMTRINTLIAENESLYKKLADSNYAMEKEFMEALRGMEQDSITLEVQLAGIKEAKATLLEEIVEAEKQVMLWEKKIQIEKETQTALDPEVGQAEAKAMEKEIHRMTLRYETLQRDQERMIKEMERAVEKREMIALRFKSKRSGATEKKSAAAEPTHAGLKKQATSLKQSLRSTQIDQAGYEEAIRIKQSELDDVTRVVEDKSNEFAMLEADARNLQRAVETTMFDKLFANECLQAANRMTARYKALQEGRRPAVEPRARDSVLASLRDAQAARGAIRGIIDQLSTEQPHMQEALRRVSMLTSIEP